ncbi:MAG: KAP family NTPase [Bifidobacteriaceae bacterium]|jgi:hypothetical protein|nr:KAP family NTPase [Bifidobacteriaceae bacterium]
MHGILEFFHSTFSRRSTTEVSDTNSETLANTVSQKDTADTATLTSQSEQPQRATNPETGDEPLPILTDLPDPDPRLGFSKYIGLLDSIISDPANGSQYTIGIFGPWGSGKTTLLNGLRERLEKHQNTKSVDDQDLIVSYFDAWRYEEYDSLAPNILSSISDQVDRLAAKEKNGTWKSIKESLGRTIAGLHFSYSVLGISISADKSIFKGNDADEVAEALATTPTPFEILREFSEKLGYTDSRAVHPDDVPLATVDSTDSMKVPKRIVIMIDDLDRCQPEGVVKILEAINTLSDIPGIIFVLGLDHDYVVKAIEKRYHSADLDGEKYLEKIIQIPFFVPSADFSANRTSRNKRAESPLQELLGKKWEEILTSVLNDSQVKQQKQRQIIEQTVLEIVTGILRSNVRQTKRFINNYLMSVRLLQVEQKKVNQELLLRLLAIQVAWPTVYSLIGELALNTGDDMSEKEDTRNGSGKNADAVVSLNDNSTMRNLLDSVSITSEEFIDLNENYDGRFHFSTNRELRAFQNFVEESIILTASVDDISTIVTTASPLSLETSGITYTGKQDHTGSTEAHRLVVKIYNALADISFHEGDGNDKRRSRVKDAYSEQGVFETVQLTRDGVHPAQGLKFYSRDDANNGYYISGNLSGFPNDHFSFSDNRGERFVFSPATDKDGYVKWDAEFEARLSDLVDFIKWNEKTYQTSYHERGVEWKERFQQWKTASPSSYATEIFTGNLYQAVNSRIVFALKSQPEKFLSREEVRREFASFAEIKNDGESCLYDERVFLVDKPIIDITNDKDITALIHFLTYMAGRDFDVLRRWTPIDKKNTGKNFESALESYREYLQNTGAIAVG